MYQTNASLCGLYCKFNLDKVLLAKLVSCAYQTQGQYYTKSPSQLIHIFLEVYKQLTHCTTAFSLFSQIFATYFQISSGPVMFKFILMNPNTSFCIWN